MGQKNGSRHEIVADDGWWLAGGENTSKENGNT